VGFSGLRSNFLLITIDLNMFRVKSSRTTVYRSLIILFIAITVHGASPAGGRILFLFLVDEQIARR